jgi:type III pantothenate kinase
VLLGWGVSACAHTKNHRPHGDIHVTEPDSERLLAVDIGNHQLKFGLLPTKETIALPQPSSILKVSTQDDSFDQLTEWLPSDRLDWYVAAVNRKAQCGLSEWVRRHRPADRYVLLGNDDLPIKIRVDAPERVGADRLLAAVAVNRLRAAGKAAIVVDAGSAITVDMVSAGGEFEGGAILPGLEMVARAMSEQTDLLPLVPYSISDGPPPVVGKSTSAAIGSGLFWGAIGAVREVVNRMSSDVEGDLQLFLAGGDAEKLSPFLPGTAQIVPELVLAGIAVTYWQLSCTPEADSSGAAKENYP